MSGLRGLVRTTKATISWAFAAPDEDDFIRITIGDLKEASGHDADLLVVSSDWVQRFRDNAWEPAQAGETIFGTPITVFRSEKMPGVAIIEAPLLRSLTAIPAVSTELEVQLATAPNWNQFPNRGDMIEGEWAAQLAIDLKNDDAAAWVSAYP